MSNKELLNRDGLTLEEFLNQYDSNKYEKPSVTVDPVIFTVANEEEDNYRKLPKKVLKVLLVRRSDHPFINCWALPGGFVDMDEDLDNAAYRELKEETNIEDIYMEQLYTWGKVNRDPRMRVISSSYLSLIDSSKVNIQAGSDADDVKWFSLKCQLVKEQKTITENGYIKEKIHQLTFKNHDEVLTSLIKTTKTLEGRITSISREVIESKGIAFDHGMIIAYGLERIRSKIEYTDIAFNLMNEVFTLTELQNVYEIILDTELLKANFRRKIAPMVIETNQKTTTGGHRPSTLFKFNPNWEEYSL